MNQQAKTNNLTGKPRDYPDPPEGFTPAQSAWWQMIRALLRQQDQEIQALRDKVNTPSKPTS